MEVPKNDEKNKNKNKNLFYAIKNENINLIKSILENLNKKEILFEIE